MVTLLRTANAALTRPAVSTPPCVSIGLPVYNGAAYLEDALDSLLAQTFEDFELIISDNASTDRTPEICRAYAAKDERVHYHRNATNIGAAQNWYSVFGMTSGKYFLSATHDDNYAPCYLERCVAAMEQNPEIVIAYSKTRVIDAAGTLVGNFDRESDGMALKPHVRLYNIIGTDMLCIQLLGLLRASTFRKTRPFVGYYGCDRNALAEFTLLGQIYEVPEYLFFHRLHEAALGAAKGSSRTLQQLLTLDPGTVWDARFVTVRRFAYYFSSVWRLCPGLTEKVLCSLQLVRLMFDKALNRLAQLFRRREVE